MRYLPLLPRSLQPQIGLSSLALLLREVGFHPCDLFFVPLDQITIELHVEPNTLEEETCNVLGTAIINVCDVLSGFP